MAATAALVPMSRNPRRRPRNEVPHEITSDLHSAATALLLGLAACRTAPKDGAALSQARNAVAQAEANPNVSKYSATRTRPRAQAPGERQGANKQKGANDKMAAQYAYLATQMARIAEQHAQEQVATARIKAGEVRAPADPAVGARERSPAGTGEAQQARNEAQNAQAQMAQAQAESQHMAAELENVQAAQSERGIVLTLGDVLFDTGRASSSPGRSVRSSRSPASSTNIRSAACRSKVSPTTRAAKISTSSCRRSARTRWPWPSSSAASTRSACAPWDMARSSRWPATPTPAAGS